MTSDTATPTTDTLQRYYRFHARIYQMTRWAFLFGRKEIIRRLRIQPLEDYILLEVGCGPGTNITYMADQFPNMTFMGVDISPDMLTQARNNVDFYGKRVSLHEVSYTDESFTPPHKPEIILFSYVLTMMNPGYEAAIERAHRDLSSGGIVAIVDFHQTRWRWFRWWMGKNHVRMEGQVLACAQKHFIETHVAVKSAFFGLWEYVVFVGLRK